MAQIQFDATQVPPAGVSQQLPVSGPEGWSSIITASEMVENKDKTGGFLAMTETITEGPHKGESGIYRLNLYHSSAKTVEIAYKQLSAICHVCGVLQIQDSQQLHNIPHRIIVGLQKRSADWKEGDPEYTEIKGVLHSDGSQPGKGKSGAPAPAQVTPPPTQPPQTNTPPAWGGQSPATTSETPSNGQPWGQNPGANTPPWAQGK